MSRAKNAIVGLFFLLARLCVTVISTLNGSHSPVFRDNQKIPKRVPPWYPKLYFEPKKKKKFTRNTKNFCWIFEFFFYFLGCLERVFSIFFDFFRFFSFFFDKMALTRPFLEIIKKFQNGYLRGTLSFILSPKKRGQKKFFRGCAF